MLLVGTEASESLAAYHRSCKIFANFLAWQVWGFTAYKITVHLGAGTHSLCTTRTHSDTLIKLRSSVMRCILRRDPIHCKSRRLFSLLASPSLCPQFCRVADGVNMLWRALPTLADGMKFILYLFGKKTFGIIWDSMMLLRPPVKLTCLRLLHWPPKATFLKTGTG